jgi:hypothetical protein
VPASRETLVDEVVVDGVLARAVSTAINIPTEQREGLRSVVTRLPIKEGQVLEAKTVAAEVAGRPIFVLSGQFPPYRDIHDGDSGPDVTQLQRALRPFYGTRVTGELDTRTAQDIDRMYDGAGYLPPSVLMPLTPGAAVAPRLPAAEVVYVASLPATVDRLHARVGEIGGRQLATLASGPWRVVAALDSRTDRAITALSSGTRVSFGSGPLAGRTGSLLTTRDQASDNVSAPTPSEPTSHGPPKREAIFAIDGGGDFPAGRAQQIRIERARGPRDAVTVPASALWTGPDGTVSVTVVDGAIHRSVVVDVLFVLRGLAAVAARDGSLMVGDAVLVGYGGAGG